MRDYRIDKNGNAIFPEKITIIEKRAFEKQWVISAVIPEGVKVIEDDSFKDTRKLKNITIPSTVEHIGWNALQSSGIVSIHIPDSVKSIGAYAFKDCKKLETIRLPKGIKEISQHCFEGCDSLKEILIPDEVKIIGEAAFSECLALKEINIPDSVEEIKRFAFSACTSLPEAIKIPRLKVGAQRMEYENVFYSSSVRYIEIEDRTIELEEVDAGDIARYFYINSRIGYKEVEIPYEEFKSLVRGRVPYCYWYKKAYSYNKERKTIGMYVPNKEIDQFFRVFDEKIGKKVNLKEIEPNKE